MEPMKGAIKEDGTSATVLQERLNNLSSRLRAVMLDDVALSASDSESGVSEHDESELIERLAAVSVRTAALKQEQLNLQEDVQKLAQRTLATAALLQVSLLMRVAPNLMSVCLGVDSQ
jgi:predicted  nucleic acid-binding Zn-ribbon protein